MIILEAMTTSEGVILLLVLFVAGGKGIFDWRLDDCRKNSTTLFSGECYHYDLEPFGFSKVQLRKESNCTFCVYRGFKGYGMVTFEYGYPECAKEAFLKTRSVHLLCANDLRHAYSQTLCCCNKDGCNGLHRSASVPFPPEYLFKDPFNLVLLRMDSRPPHVHHKDANTPNNVRGFDYATECVASGDWSGRCFNYDYFHCAKNGEDVSMVEGCQYCAYQLHWELPTTVDAFEGFPICVKGDTFNNVSKFSLQCLKSNARKEDTKVVDHKCCCTDMCNNEWNTKDLALAFYCTSTSSTTSASTTTVPTTVPTTVTTTVPSTVRSTVTTTVTTTVPSTVTTTALTTVTTAIPTTVTTTATPTVTKTTIPTSTSIKKLPITTDATIIREPPVVQTSINCYSLDFNKSVVVSASCKGCLRTVVYNIEERPFLTCLGPHLDPLDIYEQFCDQYFLDSNVLFFVYCCYTDFCNQARTPRPTLSLSLLGLLSVAADHVLRP